MIFLKLIRKLRLQSNELAPNLRRDENLQREREQIRTLVYLAANGARDTGKKTSSRTVHMLGEASLGWRAGGAPWNPPHRNSLLLLVGSSA